MGPVNPSCLSLSVRLFNKGYSQDSEGDIFMDYCKGKITKLLVDYFGNDFRRITHALEVQKYAENIMENTPCDYDTVIASALLHDVGIKPSEEKFGYNNGKTQEEYGPPVAEALLKSIDFPKEKTIRVCEIIGNHHSPSRYDYVELKILKEADRIVNKLEGD
jgi:HD superfamily phosphodiesterase